MLASYVDALDEKQSMLWVSIQGQDVRAGQTTLHGVPLPRELEGYRRCKSGDATYAITRLPHTSRNGEAQKNVFRLIAVHRTEVVHKLYYSLNPHGWLSRRYFFNRMVTFLDSFKKLAQSDALDKRMEESTRATLYAQVKRHLESQNAPLSYST